MEVFMRWFSALSALFVATGIYVGSAIVSLNNLATAAKASDGAGVLARTDTVRLRRSLVDQIVNAYLTQLGQKRPVKPYEQLAANTYGASIADAIITKMLTAENLTSILSRGEINVGEAKASMVRLTDLNTSNPFQVLKRIRPTKLVEFEVSLGDTPNDGAISLHFEGDGWKLSGIELPPDILQILAKNLGNARRG
jgi:hypothetical protein